ncbi:hypothetical protein BET01_20805 [Lacrimispora algidixylanolytica]|uniref:Uncharacterized protein n=1 Tax=Lacrimispora algidixylanolytica TaxID=94868 RepID=A0A419T1P8_9FIRM|nr:hypothetical protein BET01_20805 [Lacrimispora algidixylanolytica]
MRNLKEDYSFLFREIGKTQKFRKITGLFPIAVQNSVFFEIHDNEMMFFTCLNNRIKIKLWQKYMLFIP